MWHVCLDRSMVQAKEGAARVSPAWPPALEVRGWPSLRPVTTALGARFRRYTALSARP